MGWTFAAQLMSVISCAIALLTGIYSSWALVQLTHRGARHCLNWWLADAALFSALCFLVTKGLSIFIGNDSDITLTMWRVTFTGLFITAILSINKDTGLGPLFLKSLISSYRKVAAKVKQIG